MSLELSMVGLVVEDMPIALDYRRLGVEMPESADGEAFVMHVEGRDGVRQRETSNGDICPHQG